MFKKEPSLHEVHDAAVVAAHKALVVFHDIADDLHSAAEKHASVAASAQLQIDNLTALRDSAATAADQADRRADQVRSLVG